MNDTHHNAVKSAAQLASLGNISQRKMVAPLSCPLCDSGMTERTEPGYQIDEHIIQHLHQFALLSLPWASGARDSGSSDAVVSNATGSAAKDAQDDGGVHHGFDYADFSNEAVFTATVSQLHSVIARARETPAKAIDECLAGTTLVRDTTGLTRFLNSLSIDEAGIRQAREYLGATMSRLSQYIDREGHGFDGEQMGGEEPTMFHKVIQEEAEALQISLNNIYSWQYDPNRHMPNILLPDLAMGLSRRKKIVRTSYHMAWICSVPDLGLLPAVLMLDEEHERPDFEDHDDNDYEFGSAAGHNIVLVTCRQRDTGDFKVSRVTRTLFEQFPNLRMTLLVGIGGGVPQPTSFSSPLHDLRLGDVVVGWPTTEDSKGAVVYYQSGKSGLDGFKFGKTDKPRKVIAKAISALNLRHASGQSDFQQHMLKLQSHERLWYKLRYPGLEYDKLFRPTYSHVDGYRPDCTNCDTRELVDRKLRNEGDEDIFIYHQGPIASVTSVILDGKRRDSISADCGGVLCIETDIADIEVNNRCLVIRGISDYTDSHKSSLWRVYAAGKAVAFARELLGVIPAREIQENMGTGQLALLLLILLSLCLNRQQSTDMKKTDTRVTKYSRFFRAWVLGACGVLRPNECLR